MIQLPDGSYHYTKAQRFTSAPDLCRVATFRGGILTSLTEAGQRVPAQFYSAYEAAVVADIVSELKMQRTYGGERVRREVLDDSAGLLPVNGGAA